MKLEWFWKQKKITLENDLNTLEMMLSELFQPVTPRKQFVRGLRTDLVGSPERKNAALQKAKWQQGLMVAGGVVSFFAMIFGGFKLLMSILKKLEANRSRAGKSLTAA